MSSDIPARGCARSGVCCVQQLHSRCGLRRVSDGAGITCRAAWMSEDGWSASGPHGRGINLDVTQLGEQRWKIQHTRLLTQKSPTQHFLAQGLGKLFGRWTTMAFEISQMGRSRSRRTECSFDLPHRRKMIIMGYIENTCFNVD